MSRRRPKVDDWTNLAADRSHEDGGDPKEFHAKPWNAPKQANRKGLQLCGQVKDALHLALGGCADEVLQGLTVVSVEPAPHTKRLRVLIAAEERAGGGSGRAARRGIPAGRGGGGDQPPLHT
jgi:ribosome-binding factor A